MINQFGAFVVTYNRPQRLDRVLAAMLAQTRPPDLILVIDNGRPEPTQGVLNRLEYRGIEHHALGENRGPAGARAYAMRTLARRGCQWVAWGDDDTPPLTRDTYERLLSLVNHREICDIGAAGAVGSRFDWRRGEFIRIPDSELHGPLEVDCVGGGMQLIASTAAAETVGYPSENLFFGFEDHEYCLRLRKAGFRLLVEGELMHAYRVATNKLNHRPRRTLLATESTQALWRRYYVTRNYIYMMNHTFGRPDLARREAMKATGRALLGWLRGPRYGAKLAVVQWWGIVDGYRGRLGRTLEPAPKYLDEGEG